ncbi:hypothetical protein X975_23285, partial [Stegodyphus mimosarum]
MRSKNIMGRKEKRQRLIASIDPRFCGVVNNAQASKIESDPKRNSLFPQPPRHMKEVEPKPSDELLEKVSEDFRLFSNSNIQVQGASNSVLVNSQPRKKKKKDKSEKDLLNQVAVTADWVQKQAK